MRPRAVGHMRDVDKRYSRRALTAQNGSCLVVRIESGWLVAIQAAAHRHIGAAAATVLALFCSVLLAGFIVWVASIVDHDEIERRKIEEAQQLSSEQLNRLLNHIEEPAEGARLRRKVTLALIFAILLTGRLGLLSWLDVQQATETASRRSALLSARKARRAGQAGRRPAGGPVRPTGGGRKRDGRKRRIKRFYKSFSADAFSPKLSVSRSRIAQPRSCVPCSIRDGGHLSRGVQ
jgi:hypothetical protein